MTTYEGFNAWIDAVLDRDEKVISDEAYQDLIDYAKRALRRTNKPLEINHRGARVKIWREPRSDDAFVWFGIAHVDPFPPTGGKDVIFMDGRITRQANAVNKLIDIIHRWSRYRKTGGVTHLPGFMDRTWNE